MKRIIIMLAVTVLASAGIVNAAPINYTFTGTATGSVDSTVFSNAKVTFTISTDTENVLYDGVNIFYVISPSTAIDIAGIGSGTVMADMTVFNLQASYFSFAGLQQDGRDVVIVDSSELASYDLQSSIGPLSYGYLSQGLAAMPTTLGSVVFDNSSGFAFQAEANAAGCGDRDNDGIDDCTDFCPDENASGLDSDSDGCVDSFSGLSDAIQSFVAQGMIDRALENSLTKQVVNAQAQAEKNKICAAVNKLENALFGAINAQRGKKISPETAAFLIEYTNNLIKQLIYQLPSGKTC